MQGHRWRAEECAGRAAHLHGPRSSRKKFTHSESYYSFASAKAALAAVANFASSRIRYDPRSLPHTPHVSPSPDPGSRHASRWTHPATPHKQNHTHPTSCIRQREKGEGVAVTSRHGTCRLHLTSWRGLHLASPIRFLLHPSLRHSTESSTL
jgi:hypothetical protein